MARVTVEDCLQNVDNRFELVLVATRRARQLAYGREATLEWENDKPTVLALREIAAGNITNAILNEEAKREQAASKFSEDEAREETTQIFDDADEADSMAVVEIEEPANRAED